SRAEAGLRHSPWQSCSTRRRRSASPAACHPSCRWLRCGPCCPHPARASLSTCLAACPRPPSWRRTAAASWPPARFFPCPGKLVPPHPPDRVPAPPPGAPARQQLACPTRLSLGASPPCPVAVNRRPAAAAPGHFLGTSKILASTV